MGDSSHFVTNLTTQKKNTSHAQNITVGGCGNNDGQYDKSAGYLDFTPSTSDLSDSSAVVAELATLLTANRLSVTNRAIIENAYANSLGTGGEAKEKEALQVAKVLMVRASLFDILSQQCTLSFFHICQDLIIHVVPSHNAHTTHQTAIHS